MYIDDKDSEYYDNIICKNAAGKIKVLYGAVFEKWYLFNKGTRIEGLIGNSNGVANSRVEFHDNVVNIIHGGGYEAGAYLVTPKIDISSYSKLCISGSFSSGDHSIHVYCGTEYSNSATIGVGKQLLGFAPVGTMYFDISDLQGEYSFYIGIYYVTNTYVEYNLTEMYLM